jgi:Flp pilus assembly pilin Flp
MERRTDSLYRSFLREETAQDLVEYALLVCLLAIGSVLTWTHILSSSISTVFLTVAQLLTKLF